MPTLIHRTAASGGGRSAAAPSTARAPSADPVAGFYGPGSQMWRINREAVLLGAGPAALLLQIAHPLVAEGVAAHSRFQGDIFGRLRRTLRTTLALVFGDGRTAERAVRRLNGVHAAVRGDVQDPAARAATGSTSYHALDPALLLWVQATLIVTSIRAYEAWVEPVAPQDRERFWQEARAVGVRLGIPLSVSPASWPALIDWYEGQLAPGGPIVVTETARGLAPSIIRPPLPFVPSWVVDLAVLPGLSLLPDRIRRDFGVGWSAGHETLARSLGIGVRTWVRLTPPAWRAMPPARAAERRARASERRARPDGAAAPTPRLSA